MKYFVINPEVPSVEEGILCPQCGEDNMEYIREGDCYCHQQPPCSACVNAPLECPKCHYREGDIVTEECPNGYHIEKKESPSEENPYLEQFTSVRSDGLLVISFFAHENRESIHTLPYEETTAIWKPKGMK